MPAYSYEALDQHGKTCRGVLQGDTPRAVRGLLRERGLSPVAVAEVDEAAVGRSRRGRIGSAALALMTRQLATLVGASLPVEEALGTLAAQAASDAQRAIAVALRARVMEGASLAEALADFPAAFPAAYRASVAAGEQSGRLEQVLERLADHAEARDALAQKVLAALAYPALLTLVALGVIAGLLAWVVPQIVGVFQHLGQALPLPTRMLLALSAWAGRWGWLLLVALAALAVAARYALRREPVRAWRDAWLLRLPLVGRLVRAANTVRAMRTLALLAASAVPLLDALGVAARVVGNLPMRVGLQQAALQVREGSSFSRALEASGQFPPVAVRLIASGERSGELPRMLEAAAAEQQRELDRWLTLLTGMLAPAVILVVGALVLFIVLAILLPIFDLNQMVK